MSGLRAFDLVSGLRELADFFVRFSDGHPSRYKRGDRWNRDLHQYSVFCEQLCDAIEVVRSPDHSDRFRERTHGLIVRIRGLDNDLGRVHMTWKPSNATDAANDMPEHCYRQWEELSCEAAQTADYLRIVSSQLDGLNIKKKYDSDLPASLSSDAAQLWSSMFAYLHNGPGIIGRLGRDHMTCDIQFLPYSWSEKRHRAAWTELRKAGSIVKDSPYRDDDKTLSRFCVAAPTARAEAPATLNKAPNVVISEYHSAEWIFQRHGIKGPRLSEKRVHIRRKDAPPGFTDVEGKRPRELWHVADAIKHCSPKARRPKNARK